MKVFNIKDLYNEKDREYVANAAVTGKETVYLVYGEAEKNEIKEMTPAGQDEILLVLAGEAFIETGSVKIRLAKDQLMFLHPDKMYTLVPVEKCRYVIAGAHIVSHDILESTAFSTHGGGQAASRSSFTANCES